MCWSLYQRSWIRDCTGEVIDEERPLQHLFHYIQVIGLAMIAEISPIRLRGSMLATTVSVTDVYRQILSLFEDRLGLHRRDGWNAAWIGLLFRNGGLDYWTLLLKCLLRFVACGLCHSKSSYYTGIACSFPCTRVTTLPFVKRR